MGMPGSRQDGLERRGFIDARALADPEEDRAAAVRAERGRTRRSRRVSGHGLVGQDDLGAALREQLAKLGVLLGDRTGVGLGTPAELAPVDELLRARRPQEDAAQRSRRAQRA